LTEVKEKIIDLNVERIDASKDLEESDMKQEHEEEKKESLWDFFKKYPPFVPFFLHL